MAAAVASGSVALLLQDEPNLNPDQVKYRLMSTARPMAGDGDGAGVLDIYAAVRGTSTETSNTGIPVSQLLSTGSTPIEWGSVNWGSVNWGSVNWGSVNWGSVNWGSVNWGSVNWDY
jgi:serine protease AprX